MTEQGSANFTASGHAERSPPEQEGWVGASPDVLWRALTRDSGCSVLIVNEAGLIDFANSIASRLLAPERSAVVGTRLSDHSTRGFADERLAHCRHVMESGHTMVVVGMAHGTWGRTTIRPIEPDASGRRRVLLIRPLPDSADAAGADFPITYARRADMGRLSACTPRELEVLRLIGLGLSTPDIAARLFRSVKTIETHRVSLGHKLGLHNRVELARLAIDAGLTRMTDHEVADLIRHDEPRERKAG